MKPYDLNNRVQTDSHFIIEWVHLKTIKVVTYGNFTLYDGGNSEYNFDYHPKNHRNGLDRTLGDQNQPLFKSPRGSP